MVMTMKKDRSCLQPAVQSRMRKIPQEWNCKNIFAELPYEDDTIARINADNAVYDADLKTLVLNNKVKVETDNGMKVELQ